MQQIAQDINSNMLSDNDLLLSDSGAICYTGEVIIEYTNTVGQKKSLKKHNTGKSALFNAVTRALAGYSITDLMPTKIMCFYDNGVDTSSEALNQKIGYSATPILYTATSMGTGVEDSVEQTATSGYSNIIQYTFLIPPNSLSQKINPIARLVLYNSKDEECAELILSNEISTVDISTNILVYWRLKFEAKE